MRDHHTFNRITNSALQESSDLETWKTRPLIRVRTTPNPGMATETLTIRENQPALKSTAGQRKFLRIRVAE
ncbi:MAG: hypothetical protein QNL33_19290 [Akkermansiaceae bacterium]